MVAGSAPARERVAAVRVVRATDEHAEAVAAFISAVWTPGTSGDDVRRARSLAQAMNPLGAGTEVPAFLFLADDRVVGYVGTIPTPLWSAGETRSAHWLKGLMVLPESRNGPVGFMVLKEAVRQLGTTMALVVQPEARRLYTALGFTDHGVLEEHVRVLRPGTALRALSRPDGELAQLSASQRTALRLASVPPLRALAAVGAGALLAGISLPSTMAIASRRLNIDSQGAAGEAEIDELWARARGVLSAAPSRAGAVVRWRYMTGDERGYRVVSVRDRGKLSGLAVVRPPRAQSDSRLRGLRVATLADVIYPLDRPDCGLAAIAGAERVARRMAADALLGASTHPSLSGLLRRRAFLGLTGQVHLLSRSAPGEPSLPPSAADWWITRGDSNADEAF